MPVNPQASQANDAGKADQDSPFALLMAASASSEDKPAREQTDMEKPANDQASAQPAKPQARPESKSESKPKAKPEEKSKPDENKTADNDGQDKQEEALVADNSAPAPTSTTDTKPVAANPVPPPQPIVPLIVIADAVAPETPAQESTTPLAAAIQPAAPPAQDLAALAATQPAANDAVPQTKPVAPTAAETQPASQPQVQQVAAPQAVVAQAPASETPQGITDPQPAAPQATVQQAAMQQPAPQTEAPQGAAAAPAKEILVQIATLQNPSSAKPAQTGEKTGGQKDASAPASADPSIKTDTAQPVTRDLPAEHAENRDAKTDAPRPEVAKADTAKPDIAQQAAVEAPKPAPQVQAPPSTNIASVATNTAMQNLQAPGALPGIPQHVQVNTPATAPNMPALAVEIAAKSQSGAKQFDIRLDPPELGRVEVRLSIDAAGKASAHLSADQPQTLDLLQKDASSLTRALREAGLNVSQDGLNFSLRQQNHDGAGAQQGQGQGRNASRGTTLIATNSIEATQNSASWRGDGRLDIRV